MKKTVAIRLSTTVVYRYSDETACVIGPVLFGGECLIGTDRTIWDQGQFAATPMPHGSDTSNFEYPTLELGGFAFASIAQFDPEKLEKAGLTVGYPFGCTHLYGRLGLPQHEMLQRIISHLERVPGGILSASGVAASHLAVLFNLRERGVILRSAPIYDCTRGGFEHIYPKWEIQVIQADFTDLNKLEDAIKEHHPDKLYLETPANPTMAMIDLPGVYQLAIKYGISEIIVDNTFASPIIQKPVEIVGGDPERKIRIIHSGTKHFTGGLDGSVWGYTSLISWKEFLPMFLFLKDIGPCMSGKDAEAVLAHGMPMLHIRVEAQSRRALKLAEFLQGHPLVKKVNYPGLPPFKAMADKMFTGNGYGSILYFELDDKQLNLEDGEAFGDTVGLQSFMKLAVSLGKVYTLMENSWFMVHRFMSDEEKRRSGISPFGWRVSVGLEGIDDIIYSFQRVFEVIRDPDFRIRLPRLRQTTGRPVY